MQTHSAGNVSAARLIRKGWRAQLVLNSIWLHSSARISPVRASRPPIHAHIHTHINTPIHTHIHAFIYSVLRTHIHAHIYSVIHTHIHADIYSVLHSHIQTHIHSVFNLVFHSYTNSVFHTHIDSVIQTLIQSFTPIPTTIHSFIHAEPSFTH